VGGCLLVVALDGVQLLDGLAGHQPALAGAVLYAVLAAGMVADRREAAWVLVVMPWVPLLATLAWAVGLGLVTPHLMMGVVAAVQLVTGMAAAQALDLQGPPGSLG